MPDLKQIFAPLESLDLELTESQQVVALGLYRELAKGAPVRREQIASALVEPVVMCIWISKTSTAFAQCIRRLAESMPS